MTQLKRVAAVTGGSKGIGRACCRRLAQLGFDVAFTFHGDESGAEANRQEIRAGGGRGEMYRFDLGGADAPTDFIRRVIEDFGRIDVLVNNAATAPVAPIETIRVEDWDRVLNTNLRAAFFCAQTAFECMKRQGGGRIIFMSSQAGQAGGVFVGAHYVASKAALLGLTKSFAKAGAPFRVLCNCVSPGQIDTPLTAGFPANKVQALTQQIPMGRMGEAEEVAAVVAFLVSEDSTYITGATIPVNGGLLML